jgi:hypothetical protein
MEAKIKKEIVFILNSNSKEVLERFPCEGTFGVIDFTESLNILPGNGITFKRFKGEDALKAWNQLKRWISSQSFEQIIVVGGLDYFTIDIAYEWLFDHKDKKGFPKLILSGENIVSPMEKIANSIIK